MKILPGGGEGIHYKWAHRTGAVPWSGAYLCAIQLIKNQNHMAYAIVTPYK